MADEDPKTKISELLKQLKYEASRKVALGVIAVVIALFSFAMFGAWTFYKQSIADALGVVPESRIETIFGNLISDPKTAAALASDGNFIAAVAKELATRHANDLKGRDGPTVADLKRVILADPVARAALKGADGDRGQPGDPAFVPSGAVVAFVNACPGGDWMPYYPAAGRFIVGAGEHAKGSASTGNLDINGTKLSVFTGPGDLSEETLRRPSAANSGASIRTGGEEKHKLEISELPPHHHSITLDKKWGDKSKNETGWGSDDGNHGTTSVSTDNGADLKGQPHNNMPPFIALYFCRKEGG